MKDDKNVKKEGEEKALSEKNPTPIRESTNNPEMAAK